MCNRPHKSIDIKNTWVVVKSAVMSNTASKSAIASTIKKCKIMYLRYVTGFGIKTDGAIKEKRLNLVAKRNMALCIYHFLLFSSIIFFLCDI
jgi:hypothetical protein